MASSPDPELARESRDPIAALGSARAGDSLNARRDSGGSRVSDSSRGTEPPRGSSPVSSYSAGDGESAGNGGAGGAGGAGGKQARDTNGAGRASDGATPTGPTAGVGAVPPNSRALNVGAVNPAGVPAGMKVLLVGALVTIMCAGLSQIQNIFAPAFFALTLVLTVRPIHRWLLRKGMPVWLSAVVTITTLMGTLLTIVGLMAWSLVGLPDVVRSYGPSFQRMLKSAMDFAKDNGLNADQLTAEFLGKLDFGQAVNTLTNVINSLSSTTALIALIALALLFITIDTMSVDSRANVVEKHDSNLYEALSSFEGRVRQYWLVSTIFGLIVAVFNYVVLQVLDVPLPVAWALFSFVTNYIPNIGFVIGVIPPALMGLLDSGWVTAVWVIVAYSVINATIQGVLQPKFTGDAVGLSTTVTFLSLVFWTLVVGPLGAILAVLLTLFAKALLVDSSPQTRWMESFLIPETESKKRADDKYYDKESPSSDTFVDFTAQNSEERKRIRRTLRSVSLRKLRARTEQK